MKEFVGHYRFIPGMTKISIDSFAFLVAFVINLLVDLDWSQVATVLIHVSLPTADRYAIALLLLMTKRKDSVSFVRVLSSAF